MPAFFIFFQIFSERLCVIFAQASQLFRELHIATWNVWILAVYLLVSNGLSWRK